MNGPFSVFPSRSRLNILLWQEKIIYKRVRGNFHKYFHYDSGE
jgi:hypothetical protein